MRLLFATLLATVLLGSASVQAHKVVSALYPGTGVIEGEIGFSNGDVAADALVEVFDGEGNKLGETRTDGDGFFTYTPTTQTEHVFRANLGAGHIAEVHIAAEDLPVLAGATNTAATTPTSASNPVPTSASAAAVAAVAIPLADQRAMVAEEVRRALRPLQKEIAAYKEKNDMQSILGGLGYIAGLFGIGFYVAARRSRAAA